LFNIIFGIASALFVYTIILAGESCGQQILTAIVSIIAATAITYIWEAQKKSKCSKIPKRTGR